MFKSRLQKLVQVQLRFYSLMVKPCNNPTFYFTNTSGTPVTVFPLSLQTLQPKPPFSTPTTIMPHSNSEHKHLLNSRHGTDPTVCLGTYGEPIEVNVLTVTQPLRKERSAILMYMFEQARRCKCGYSAGRYELSKLPVAGQPIETCRKKGQRAE